MHIAFLYFIQSLSPSLSNLEDGCRHVPIWRIFPIWGQISARIPSGLLNPGPSSYFLVRVPGLSRAHPCCNRGCLDFDTSPAVIFPLPCQALCVMGGHSLPHSHREGKGLERFLFLLCTCLHDQRAVSLGGRARYYDIFPNNLEQCSVFLISYKRGTQLTRL